MNIAFIYLILLLRYGCNGEILDTDRECFVPDNEIQLKEYLPDYMRCHTHIVQQDLNLTILRRGAYGDLRCDFLSLKRNKIEVIYSGVFSGSSITVLDLSENLLKCIFADRFQVNDLELLDLSKNKITYIEPGSFPATITDLDLSFNRIREFDTDNFDNCEDIRELSLAGNGLISLKINKNLLSKLEKLDLSYNSLQQYDFSDLTSLSYLNLKNNELRRLTKKSFSNLDNLEELDLSNNKLEDALIMVEPFPRLVKLRLQNNNIKHIQDNLFLSSRNLGELDLSGNSLQTFNFSNNKLRKLWCLKLNNMGLRQIQPVQFLNLDALYELELFNNSLSDFDDRFDIPTLWRLDLSFNRLTRIWNNFVNLKALGNLDLSHNDIHLFNIGNCELEKMWKMKLNNNNIARIRDRSMPDLKVLLFLDLSSNHLKTFSISEDKLQRLRIIDMSFNNISYYDEETFRSLTRLRFLSLRNNIIGQVPPNILYENSQMFHLDLSYNLITSFKYNRKASTTSLKTFNIFGNPINCIHLRQIEEFCSKNHIDMNICDGHCRADGKTPICVDYGCDCGIVFSSLTEMYLQKVPRNDIHRCSFEELTHNIV